MCSAVGYHCMPTYYSYPPDYDHHAPDQSSSRYVCDVSFVAVLVRVDDKCIRTMNVVAVFIGVVVYLMDHC